MEKGGVVKIASEKSWRTESNHPNEMEPEVEPKMEQGREHLHASRMNALPDVAARRRGAIVIERAHVASFAGRAPTSTARHSEEAIAAEAALLSRSTFDPYSVFTRNTFAGGGVAKGETKRPRQASSVDARDVRAAIRSRLAFYGRVPLVESGRRWARNWRSSDALSSSRGSLPGTRSWIDTARPQQI